MTTVEELQAEVKRLTESRKFAICLNVRAKLQVAKLLEEKEELLHLLSESRDFIAEGDSIHLIGAREFVDKVDRVLREGL